MVSMKNFKDLCASRRSVRAYSDRPVQDADLQYIMECVRLAPSAVNRQPWRVLRLKPEQLPLAQQCYTNPWFRTAPECFIVCCDHAESWHRPKDGKDHGDVDIAICAEHFCLAAAERGLGTCWVCNFDADLCRRLFHLPDTLEPVAFLPLGYEAADHQPRPFQRKEIDELWLTAEN